MDVRYQVLVSEGGQRSGDYRPTRGGRGKSKAILAVVEKLVAELRADPSQFRDIVITLQYRRRKGVTSCTGGNRGVE